MNEIDIVKNRIKNKLNESYTNLGKSCFPLMIILLIILQFYTYITLPFNSMFLCLLYFIVLGSASIFTYSTVVDFIQCVFYNIKLISFKFIKTETK